ncbi:electron transport complex subunit RsxC [Xenophilus sp. AP218F]|nr:electron transport complex subunit RsxC [Xenophilus sp. AP218F]
MNPIYPLPGGIHPPSHKHLTNSGPIAPAPLPRRLILSLGQSLGNPARPCVAVGERVLKGQRIAEADGAVSAALHAPTSGTVVAIESRPFPHRSGLPQTAIVLEADGLDEWQPRAPLPNWRELDAAALSQHLRDMGVVGQGGAVFPTSLKLAKRPLEALVINGAECEPFITCDDALMRERADGIVSGVAIIAHAMQAGRVLIGIEDDKPAAIAAMRQAAAPHGYQVAAIPAKYPSGGAKQLIRLLTGKEIPAGERATQHGAQCFNVATAYSVHRAVELGEPVISRIVTLTGAMAAPQNVEALLGTPLRELLAHAGQSPDSDGVIVGGSMMGYLLPDADAGLTKACNCLIARDAALFPPRPPAMPCIRCGECADACPVQLQPMDLYWFAKSKRYDKASDWSLMDCIECGACSYVCPSQIPLVDYFQFAKGELWSAERDKLAADRARRRHEFRQFRIERDKQEKAQRLAEKAAATPAPTRSAPAGMSAGQPAKPVSDADKKAAIEAAMARAAARKATLSANANASQSALDESKQAAIKAAMERAAARKAAKDAEAAPANEPAAPAAAIDDAKRAAIQAAMERAAARKAAKAAAQSNQENEQP